MKYLTSKILSVMLLQLLVISVFVAQAQSPNPQETLNQYLSELQNNPNDYALREKIIRHVQTMKPAPAIPEEARRHYVKGRALSEDAKQPSEFADAAGEFQKALLVAPWWGEAYLLMGIALEAAQRYDDATTSLKLSMSANQSEELRRKTQDEIYKIEAKAERAAKKTLEDRQKQQDNAETKKYNEQEDWLKKLDGARYSYSFRDDDDGSTITWALEIQGKALIQTTNGFARRQWGEWGRFEILGREFVQNQQLQKMAFRISETTITVTSENNDGSHRSVQVYRRER